MRAEDTGATKLLELAGKPHFVWMHKNPQLLWAIVSAVAAMLVVGGGAVAVFRYTLSTVQETQAADRKHIDEALSSIAGKVDELSKNGPTVTNANIKAVSDRLEKQEAWHDRVEAAAEIRIPKARK